MEGVGEQDKASWEGVGVVEEGREEERWEEGDIEARPETKQLAVALFLTMYYSSEAVGEQKVSEGYKKVDRAQYDHWAGCY